jgi:hypothetical protein
MLPCGENPSAIWLRLIISHQSKFIWCEKLGSQEVIEYLRNHRVLH